MKEVTIHLPSGDRTFIIGQKLMKNGEQTEIVVNKINKFFHTIKVHLSNKDVIVFKNCQYTYIYGR